MKLTVTLASWFVLRIQIILFADETVLYFASEQASGAELQLENQPAGS